MKLYFTLIYLTKFNYNIRIQINIILMKNYLYVLFLFFIINLSAQEGNRRLPHRTGQARILEQPAEGRSGNGRRRGTGEVPRNFTDV